MRYLIRKLLTDERGERAAQSAQRQRRGKGVSSRWVEVMEVVVEVVVEVVATMEAVTVGNKDIQQQVKLDPF